MKAVSAVLRKSAHETLNGSVEVGCSILSGIWNERFVWYRVGTAKPTICTGAISPVQGRDLATIRVVECLDRLRVRKADSCWLVYVQHW